MRTEESFSGRADAALRDGEPAASRDPPSADRRAINIIVLSLRALARSVATRTTVLPRYRVVKFSR
jgi:hypothetical protein